MNDKVVVEVPKLRAATADTDTTNITLQPGENVLLVEVSQAGGGWGLFLRFETPKGRKLRLLDDGTLTELAK